MARKNDWIAKMRMWVTIQRWATIGDLQHQHQRRHQSDDAVAELQIQKRSHKRQKRNVETSASDPRVKATASSSGTRKSRILAFTVSSKTMAQLKRSSFANSQPIPMQSAEAEPRRLQAKRPEAVDQQRHQDELLDGGGPFDEGQVGAGVLEDHGLVDHRQFEVSGWVIHRNPARLRNQHQRERGEGEHLRGGKKAPVLPDGGSGNLA